MLTTPQKANRQSCTGLKRICVFLGCLISIIGTSSVEASPFSTLELALEPFAEDIRSTLEPQVVGTNRVALVGSVVGKTTDDVLTPAGWEPSAHALLHGQHDYDFSELEQSVNGSKGGEPPAKPSAVDPKRLKQGGQPDAPIRPNALRKPGATVPKAPGASLTPPVRLRFRLGAENLQQKPPVNLDKSAKAPGPNSQIGPNATVTVDKP